MYRKLFMPLFFISITAASLIAQPSDGIASFISTRLPEWEAYYKNLHTNPELSFQEEKTAAGLAESLRKAGCEVTEHFGGNGVVGLLRNGKGPVVLVRADMDALPVQEETGLPYASKVKAKNLNGELVSVMHACGHDIHTTVLMATAQTMARFRDQWKGTLVFIGQPAEERVGGAKAMLAEGLYTRFPRPDYVIGLHVNAGLPAGKVAYCPEYAFANVDMLDITVQGVSGHGAYPHQTIDPIVLSAKLILDLQTIVSREKSPLEPAVVTVGSIHGGTKGNIIPEQVKMELTLRSYNPEVRKLLIDRIRQKCRAAGMSAGLPEDKYPQVVQNSESCAAVYNDPGLSTRIAKAFEQALGKENVEKLGPVMGAEDFSLYGLTNEKVPITIYWLGSVEPALYRHSSETGEKLPSLHSSRFAPAPAATITTGVRSMSAALFDLLGK